MKFDPQKHHRRSIRLKGYDYTQTGAYFITIVVWQRECLFGGIVDGEMRLNQFGKIVQRAWLDLPKHYPHVQLGTFCIMPNHVHLVLIPYEISDTADYSLTKIMHNIKRNSANHANKFLGRTGAFWQHESYDHFARDDKELERIIKYVFYNPVKANLVKEQADWKWSYCKYEM